jgi:intracellular septation protein
MKQALRRLGEDFLSAIVFFALYALTGSLYIGVGAAVAIGVAQVAWRMLTGRPTDLMQWASLGLVIVLGGASALLHTPRLMMIKPSIAHFSIAAIMLRRGWMRRYMPAPVQQYVPEAVIDAAGFGWAGLMAALGVANLIIALDFSIAAWGWFITFGAIGAKLVAFALQYFVFRTIVRRRIRAIRAAGAGASPLTPALAE